MLSPLHNVSNEMIADQLGRLDTNRKFLVEQIDKLKAELKRRGVTAARGEEFAITVSESTPRGLDTEKVKALLGDELADYQRETPTTRFTIKPAPRLSEVA